MAMHGPVLVVAHSRGHILQRELNKIFAPRECITLGRNGLTLSKSAEFAYAVILKINQL